MFEKEDNGKLAVLMIGIQGSGKSRFCRQFFSEMVRISLDELHTRNKERLLFEQCIHEEKDIVIDNTNPTVEDRNRYIPELKQAGYKVIAVFMQSVLKDCIKRNEEREGKERVPNTAIAATSNKLEIPDRSEGFDEMFYVSIKDDGFCIEEWRE